MKTFLQGYSDRPTSRGDDSLAVNGGFQIQQKGEIGLEKGEKLKIHYWRRTGMSLEADCDA